MLKKIIKKCSSSEINYQFYSSIDKLPKLDWEHFNTKGNILFKPGYLKGIESSLKNEIEFNYILFFDPQKKPIGFAVTQFITVNTKELQSRELPYNICKSIKNTLLKNIDVNVLVCGNIYACGEHHFVFNEQQISHKEAYLSLTKALKDTRNMDHSEKPSYILIKEFWPQTFENSNEIIKEGFSEINIDPNMVLKLKPHWKTFDDYLVSMRTKFRTRAKKVLSNSKSIETKNLTANDLIFHKKKIEKLYYSVIDNAYFKLGKLNIEVFISLKETLLDKFIFTGYFIKSELIGFKTCFVQQNNIEAFHVGFDYNYKKSHNIYQRILYDYVDLAIKHKVPRLLLGRTSETIKSCVGAEPVDMKLFVRHRNSISNKLLKPLTDFITPNQNEIRNPFKKILN